jgi:hypothetical protein
MTIDLMSCWARKSDADNPTTPAPIMRTEIEFSDTMTYEYKLVREIESCSKDKPYVRLQ